MLFFPEQSKKISFPTISFIFPRHPPSNVHDRSVSPGTTCMKMVGTLWTNSMTGWSAAASSRKKTTLEAQATSRATRAPNRSPNLQTSNVSWGRSSFLVPTSWLQRFLPSEHGAAHQLDQTHGGLQVAEPQGVEAQPLGHVLQGHTGRGRRTRFSASSL